MFTIVMVTRTIRAYMFVYLICEQYTFSSGYNNPVVDTVAAMVSII